MKTFILILIFVGPNKGGPAMAEFANEDSCKAALEKVEKLIEDTSMLYRVHGLCVPTWEPGTK